MEYSITYPISARNPKGDPLPTQEKFHNSPSKYRLLAGGFGTGKTTSICIEAIKDIGIPNNYILMGRKDLQEFKTTTLKELLDILPPNSIADHNKTDRIIKFVNGTELFYTNLDASREAVEKIKSLNLGCAIIDQLEELDEMIFEAIKGRLRRLNTRRCFYATCNPEGHDWIYRRWKELPFDQFLILYNINKVKAYEIIVEIMRRENDNAYNFENMYDGFEYGKDIVQIMYDKFQYGLFEAITTENIYLPQDYINGLLSMPDKWVKRYVYCSWDDFEGLVYNEFVESKHVINYYEPSESDRIHIVLDYGFRNPTCVLFIATDFDGINYVFDEIYWTGKLVSETAEEIRRRRWHRSTKLADPSIFNTQRDGKSVGDEFIEYGLSFIPANNDVQQGINRVNQLFKDNRIYVTRNCINFLREIGNYKWKQLKVGQMRNEHEEPIKKDDHAMDCLRYFCNYIHVPIRKKEEPMRLNIKIANNNYKTLADF